jgi:predicted  nucleic acid-binding Zn-ribbon protein
MRNKMSMLTRESAKEKMYRYTGVMVSSPQEAFINELFDQHEDETAQLRMEITELRQLVAERNELIKELEDECTAAIKFSNDKAYESARWYKEYDKLREQLGGEVVAEFEGVRNGGQSEPEAIYCGNDKLTESKRLVRMPIDEFEAETGCAYKVLIIKQKGE